MRKLPKAARISAGPLLPEGSIAPITEPSAGDEPDGLLCCLLKCGFRGAASGPTRCLQAAPLLDAGR
jgi:hypothetical protein